MDVCNLVIWQKGHLHTLKEAQKHNGQQLEWSHHRPVFLHTSNWRNQSIWAQCRQFVSVCVAIILTVLRKIWWQVDKYKAGTVVAISMGQTEIPESLPVVYQRDQEMKSSWRHCMIWGSTERPIHKCASLHRRKLEMGGFKGQLLGRLSVWHLLLLLPSCVCLHVLLSTCTSNWSEAAALLAPMPKC